MSFKDCIDSALEVGRVSADRAAKAKVAHDDEFQKALLSGADEATAELTAARAATEQLSTANAARRWQKMKDIQAAHVITKRLTNAKDPSAELLAMMESVDDDYMFVQSVAFSYLDQMLLKYKPRALQKARTDGQDATVYASFGQAAGPEATADAKALKDMYEMLRQWANRHGATIPKSKENHLPQTHDAVRVSRVQEYTRADGTRSNGWVDDHMKPGIIDWDTMRLDGKLIPEGERRDALLNMYDGIVADGKMRDKYLVEGGQAGNLATRLGRDRFLHYAGPEAWIEMQGKYGAGNLFQQTIGMVDHMSKEISMLRTFGTSPGSMKEFAARLSENQAAKKAQAAGKNVKAATDKAKRKAKVFNDMFDIHDRRVTSADGNWAVQAISGIRTVAVGSKLGSVLIPSFFGDLTNAKVMNKLYGLPSMGVMRKYFAEVGSGRIGKEDAMSLGIIFEDAIGLAQSRMRYFGALDGPHAARVFSDQVYRIGLASAHTQIARNATGKQFLNFLHTTKGVKFDDHPLAAAMLETGITEKDWNLLRATPSRNIRGGNFLAPIDLMKGDRSAQEVAEKFGSLLQSYIKTAVPDTNLRSRRAAGEAIDPNSAIGQMARTMLSLLSFPMALHFNQLARIARLPTVRDKMVYGASYVGWMSVAGAFITQGKALANGQQLMDMSLFDEEGKINLDFYGRAVINGGSMGILGDLVMNSVNINNSSYRPGDPTTELLKAVHKVTADNLIDVAQGNPADVPADLYNLGDQLVPKFWHTKVLLERAILDDLEQQADPEGYRRAQQYQREHSEGMWWPSGGGSEALRPETAFGG